MAERATNPLRKAGLTDGKVTMIWNADPPFYQAWMDEWPWLQDGAGIGSTYDPKADTFGPPDPIAPEPVDRTDMRLSFPQLLIGLVTEKWITEAEGDAWVDGTLPAAVSGLISTLPSEMQFAARVRAKRPSEVLRDDPLVNALGAAQKKTPEELDAFFRTYAAV